MTLTVRLDPLLESRVEQEARRLGITKSDFVKNALERVLGDRNPYQLLQQARHAPDYAVHEPATEFTDDSENVAGRVKEKLSAKHSG